MNGANFHEDVTVYLDWWPRKTEEIDEPFTRHGWKVEGGVVGRSPRQFGAGPDFTQVALVVSLAANLLTGSLALSQLIGITARSVKELLHKKRPDERIGITIDIPLDGQTEGDDTQQKWRTGRYLMITLPPDEEEQNRALEALSLIEVPSLPNSEWTYTTWAMVWEPGPRGRWSLRLVLPTKST